MKISATKVNNKYHFVNILLNVTTIGILSQLFYRMKKKITVSSTQVTAELERVGVKRQKLNQCLSSSKS